MTMANHGWQEFFVDGTNFPNVTFDIGESYAGLLPNTPHGNSSLFFWFFPSTNPKAKKEVSWLYRCPSVKETTGKVQRLIPVIHQCRSQFG